MPDKPDLPILQFASVTEWEAWLAAEPRSSPGVWLKLAKRKGPARGVVKEEAIDAALCHGWIDGQLGRLDDAFWRIRFTPRRPRSRWSENNRKRAGRLIAEGRMCPSGLAEIDAAKADGRWDAAYASQSKAVVPDDFATALIACPDAKAAFEQLDAANRYAFLYRLHHAKTDAVRREKLQQFVAMLARGEVFHPKPRHGTR